MPNEQQKKAERAIRPTLFIGLGGTGKEVLLRLRRKFYERFGEPKLPCVAYLWLDTDTRNVDARGENLDEIYQAVTFKEDERIPLLEGKVREHLGGVFINRFQYEHIHRWIYDNVDRYGGEISDGAGGVRAIGRLTFFYHYDAIEYSIKTVLKDINSQEVIEDTKKLRGEDWKKVDFDPTPQVFLITSVAGGTGCGLFLDTVFLLKKLSREGISLERVVGIALLPNVYYPTAHGELAVRSYGNACAALKEVEYYTLRDKKKRCERCQAELELSAVSCFNCGREVTPGDTGTTPDFEVEWKKRRPERIQGPPFSVTYILEMTNESGIPLKTRSELFHMIAESLFLDFMPSEFSNAKRSDHSNVALYLSSDSGTNVLYGGVALNQSFARRYASFGMSKIEVPVDAVKGACASQLAYDILEYWARKTSDPNIRAHVLEDMAKGERPFNADGLIKRFGTSWKETIESEVKSIFQRLSIKEPRHVDDLATKMEDFERRVLREEGTDKTRWGTVIGFIRDNTQSVLDELRRDLEEWLKESLENEARGLKALIQEEGYLRHLAEYLKEYYTFREDGQKPEYELRKEAAQRDLDNFKKKKEKNLQELKVALKSLGVTLLGLKEETVKTLLDRLKEAEQQYALARARACLLDEAKDVAKGAVDFLESKKPVLQRFMEAVDRLAKRFESKKNGFLNFGESVLFIRVFDENEDWPKFYTLGENRQRPIAKDEQERFLEEVAKKEQKQFPDKAKISLWEFIQKIYTREGESALEARVAGFCEEKFRGDFNTYKRDINVLEKLEKIAGLDETVERLVRCALPMVQRDSHLGGEAVPVQKHAYLGLAEKESDPYRGFISMVERELRAKYKPHLFDVQPTGKPWEVYLYIVSYAFPLPSLPTVREDCHKAYYDFYKMQRAGQVGDRKFYIPLHLSKEWEGVFDDLVVYGDQEAREIKEALEVLLFGSILKVLELREVNGEVRYYYRRKVGASSQREELGRNRREATEALRGDTRFRRILGDKVKERVKELEKEENQNQCQAYFWILEYLRWSGRYKSASPEKALLETEVKKVWKTLEDHGAKRLDFSLDDVDEENRAGKAKERLGDRAEWIGGFPVLKDLKLWESEG